jgi:hypothetical protein
MVRGKRPVRIAGATKMKVARIAVGGLMLEKNEKWNFDVQLDVIVGRRYNDTGVLCIRHVERNTLPGPLNHEYCLEMARQMLSVPAGPATDVEAMMTPCGPYGAATFAATDDVRRVWYCNRPPGLIVGVYTCALEFARDALYTFIRGECAHLVATAVFDRPSWGGDDPLTRVLIDGLEGLERPGPR